MTDTSLSPHSHDDLARLLEAGLAGVLDAIGVAVVVVDADGLLRFANEAAADIVGSCAGSSYLDFVPHRYHKAARTRFEHVLDAGRPTTERLELVDRDGRPVEVLARAGRISNGGGAPAVLGVALPVAPARTHAPVNGSAGAQRLTPRQEQVLRLLAEGRDTEAIASELGVALETARNHIRAVLARLGVHSRLEAVLAAWRQGLLDVRAGDA
jgi:PAS domain S-box-containing protein